MLWLNSKTDRPDFEWFTKFLLKRCEEGIRVKRPLEAEEDALRLSKEAADVLLAEYGIENPNSPKQILAFIASCGDPFVIDCCTEEIAGRKTGKLTSKEDALAKLAAAGYKWALQILKYRDSYGIVKNIRSVMECADKNSLVHPEISFQKTNRVSYKAPAITNINKQILWQMVQPTKEGNYLWSADIKNQEPWIMVHLTGAKQLIDLAEKASEGAGGSIYKAIYEDIFGTSIVSEEAYSEMKTAWNMLTYGGTLQGLRESCRIIDADRIYQYFNGIKELKAYRSRTYALKTRGVQSVETVFGTTVYTDKNGGALQRSLMDLPMQGTGADILAFLVKHITDETEKLGISEYIKVYFTRHDEVILEVDKDWQDENGAECVAETIAELTSHRVDDWVPFKVDVKQLN